MQCVKCKPCTHSVLLNRSIRSKDLLPPWLSSIEGVNQEWLSSIEGVNQEHVTVFSDIGASSEFRAWSKKQARNSVLGPQSLQGFSTSKLGIPSLVQKASSEFRAWSAVFAGFLPEYNLYMVVKKAFKVNLNIRHRLYSLCSVSTGTQSLQGCPKRV